MDNMERVFSELRALRKQLDGVVQFSALPRAMKYKTAAKALDVELTVLKQLVRQGLIRTVEYHPGGHPRIPVEEIERLTKLRELPIEKPRGKPSRRRTPATASLTPEQTRAALKKL